jgi:hypothetical protein
MRNSTSTGPTNSVVVRSENHLACSRIPALNVGLDPARTPADAEIVPIREPQSVNVLALRDLSAVLMQRLGGLRSKVLCLTWPKARSRRLYTDTICMRYFHGDQACSRRDASRERVET